MTTKLYPLVHCLLLTVSFISCKSSLLSGNKSPQEVYGDRLKRADLDKSVMGAKWFAAAGQSLAFPLEIKLPYKEAGFFSPTEPGAFGYQFHIPQGQKVEIAVSSRSSSSSSVFAELWEPNSAGEPDLLTFADSSGKLTYEAHDEDKQVILRLQTELLTAVSYTLSIATAPSFTFPVPGGNNSDIGSIWGDPRDAGARKHEGIDIFGKRGTPVVAAADGRVISVREGGLGGKTVWMKPRGSGITLYYAHLDSQLVLAGQSVNTGDTLGLMGNTGNARTTPPHLHFGIYGINGAINPLPFVKKEGSKAAPIIGNERVLGKAARTSSSQQLYLSTVLKGSGPELDKHTYLIITAATGNLYKVLLPDGTHGFLPVSSVTELDKAIKTVSKKSPANVLSEPGPNSAVSASLYTGMHAVKAYFNGYAYVESDSLTGWIKE